MMGTIAIPRRLRGQAIAVGALLLLAVFSGWSRYSSDAEEHASQVQAAQINASQTRLVYLGNLLGKLQDAETGQRGYLLTGRASYLVPYALAIDQIPVYLMQLSQAYEGDASAPAKLAAIRELVASKLEELELTVRLRKEQGFAAAQAVVLQDFGRLYMERLRVRIGDMVGKERAAISSGAQWLDGHASSYGLVQVFSSGSLFILVGICMILIIRESRRTWQVNEKLSHDSTHDPLTGLANRTGLMLAMENGFMLGLPKSIHYVDLNGFKAVNDELSHLSGDRLLKEVARSLNAITLGREIVARLGGDEFVVLSNRQSDAQCHELKSQIENAVATICSPFLKGRRVSASVGFATGVAEPTVLLDAADAGMYREKARTKGLPRMKAVA
jgi:diguanylate cyclase (GGDEF)-like protein